MIKQITILQVNEKAENGRYIMFSGLDFINKMGLNLSIDTYNQVYEGQITTSNDDPIDILDDIYCDFNIRRPNDFKGHSLSTSDMVKMDGKYYFCDEYGWQEMKLSYGANGWEYKRA